MGRKTIHVDKLIDQVNLMLETSTCSPDARYGMIQVLSYILHETDNYRGFRYLTQNDRIPTGQAVGKELVDRDEEGNPIWGFPDNSRRQYAK